jgi:hypothetical protein
MRFFISYRRRVDSDRVLAGYLCDGLKAAGHEVFIDVDIPVGTEWAAEIGRRIDWCDCLVVLLSEQSVQSEMVQGEVRLAHHRGQPNGRPRVLPIRVGYEGPLGYELECYLAPLQYISWHAPADSSVILKRLLGLPSIASETRLVPPSEAPAPAAGAAKESAARPSPSVDPRLSRKRPGGAIRGNDPFYIHRSADDRITEIAAGCGETLVIKGPRQMGKTSLLMRYIDEGYRRGKHCAFVDFQGFANSDLEDYLTFLSRLTSTFLRCLDLAETVAVPRYASQQQFAFFVEDHIIRRVGGPLILALDEVDRVLGRPYQRDFFALLRAWHNDRAKPQSPWEQVDLALVIATEPYVLIDCSDQSPFNVTLPIEPGPYPRAALDELNARYGRLLGTPEVDQLFELLSGHPYLTRLAFYRLVTGMSFRRLLEDAASADGPFGEHLRHLLLLLHEGRANLSAALQRVIDYGTTPDEHVLRRLEGAGLVIRSNGRVVPANLLYARFFKAVR